MNDCSIFDINFEGNISLKIFFFKIKHQNKTIQYKCKAKKWTKNCFINNNWDIRYQQYKNLAKNKIVEGIIA